MVRTIQTRVLDIDPAAMDPGKVQEVASALKEGKVVAVPTETVYGLAADAFNADAVEGIFTAKGRPSDNPLIVHVHSRKMLSDVVEAVPEKAERLISRFWPGPLTMILKKKDTIPNNVTAGMETVGVRMPSHPVFREISRAAGIPLAAPSANYFGRPSPTSAEDVQKDMEGRIPLIISSGECLTGIESTILSLVDDPPILLRPGGVSLEDIKKVVGDVKVHDSVVDPNKSVDTPDSPGMKYKHYSPEASVIIIEDVERFKQLLEDKDDERIMLISSRDIDIPSRADVDHHRFKDSAEMARNLFSSFRRADSEGIRKIYVLPVSEEGIGMGLMNRIKKAATSYV